ncbi:site-specific recombinase XerD [Flavobacterium gossypii]|uniref:Site-specific recombinase XerD n=1 Tax=Flavobacterium gossypii TaxID=1646119 RepID=A0ABR6DTF1_9FLAO|nr:tyrosine-type recombinase/integrase [Flavobacterium gossypii]MBA9074723.1 site-specific recombinase XerD [Flavobacterium gossypii]
MNNLDFPKYVTNFISKHLPFERGLSHNTVRAYRDAIVLLIIFLKVAKKLKEANITVGFITKDTILEFLEWLQVERNSSDSTRNSRLAAIKSFFKYIKEEDIGYIYQFQQIQSIRIKKTVSKLMSYLTIDGLKLLLQQPDISSMRGRRDLVLISLIYDSGARVQEIIDLTPSMIRIDRHPTIQLLGKGKKMRLVPLIFEQVINLKHYLKEQKLLEPQANRYPVFFNSRKEKLTRAGINHIISKYAEKARLKDSSLIPKELTCHSLRHSKAMHLFQHGYNIVYIRDFLGHSSIITTERYARADSKFKREALEKASININQTEEAMWNKNDSLINWLNHF